MLMVLSLLLLLELESFLLLQVLHELLLLLELKLRSSSMLVVSSTAFS